MTNVKEKKKEKKVCFAVFVFVPFLILCVCSKDMEVCIGFPVSGFFSPLIVSATES